MTGVERIAAERARQIEAEGWTPEHDASHGSGEMAAAAAGYVGTAYLQASGQRHIAMAEPPMWPWAYEWWKPSDDPIRNLEKAGALIAAEIDRLQGVPVKASNFVSSEAKL